MRGICMQRLFHPTRLKKSALLPDLTKYIDTHLSADQTGPLSQVDDNKQLKITDPEGQVYAMCEMGDEKHQLPAGEITQFIRKFVKSANDQGALDNYRDKKPIGEARYYYVEKLFTNFINYFANFKDKEQLQIAIKTIKPLLKKDLNYTAMVGLLDDISAKTPLTEIYNTPVTRLRNGAFLK